MLMIFYAERGHQSVHEEWRFDHRLSEVSARNRTKEGYDRLRPLQFDDLFICSTGGAVYPNLLRDI